MARHPSEVLGDQLASYVAVKEALSHWTQPVYGWLAAQILKREIPAWEALVQHERGGAGDFALSTHAAALLLLFGLAPPTVFMHHVRDWPAEARFDGLAREDALEADWALYAHTGLLHCDVAGALGTARRSRYRPSFLFDGSWPSVVRRAERGACAGLRAELRAERQRAEP